MQGELTPSDAIVLVHEDTGRLRDVARVATDALKLAARRKLRNIDRELIVRALGDGAEAVTDD